MTSQFTPYQHTNYQRQPQYVNFYAYDRQYYNGAQLLPVRSRSYNDLAHLQIDNLPYHLRAGPMTSPVMMTQPTVQAHSPANQARHSVPSNGPSAEVPAILPRYRGKHIRAASTGSIALTESEQSSEINTQQLDSTSNASAKGNANKTVSASSKSTANHQSFQGAVQSQGLVTRHRRDYNSLSSSNASIDTDSTRTQTSMSSAGSINSGNSWSDDENKPKLVAKTARHDNIRGSNASTTASIRHKGGAGASTENSTSKNPVVKSSTSASRISNPSSGAQRSESTSSMLEANARSASKALKVRGVQYKGSMSPPVSPGISVSTKSLILPSDLRPRSYQNHAESARDRPISAARIRNGSDNNSAVLNRVDRVSQRHMSLPSYPVDSRPVYNSSPRMLFSDSMAQEQHIKQELLPSNQSRNESGGAGELNSVSSSTKVDLAPHTPLSGSIPRTSQCETVSVQKSRSFGSKLRDLFGSKSRTSDHDDTQSIMSTKSSKSILSIRSANSIMSFSSRFSRKRRSESVSTLPSMIFSPEEPSQSSRPPSSGSSISSTSMRTGKKKVDHQLPVPVAEPVRPLTPAMNKPSTVSSVPRLEPGLPPMTTNVRPNQLSHLPAKPSDSLLETNRSDDENSTMSPRPPSPALRSAISTKLDSPSSSVNEDDLDKDTGDDSRDSHKGSPAAHNLSAGDIFPGLLKAENVETIVSSVERTGSFKRQPSTSKRSIEEVVPDAQEIEVEVPESNSGALMSAMKRGTTRRKRSGATSNPLKVHFASQILVYKTYSSQGYDRTPDRMTCDRLGEPGMAQKLREELNHWKALMPVHPSSAGNTQFFQT